MSLIRNPRLFNLIKCQIYCSSWNCRTKNQSIVFPQAHKLRDFKVYTDSTRAFATNLVQAEELPDHRNNTDVAFRQCENDQRRVGFVRRRQVIHMYEAMRKNKTLTPGQSLFLLRCCGNLANMENVSWRRGMASKVINSLEEFGVVLDISHYNMILRVHLDNDTELNPLEFLETLAEKEIEPNRATYVRLIEYYCQNGNIEGPNKILELMKEKSYPLNEDIFNALILGNAKNGDLQGALSIVDAMKQSDLTPGPRTCAMLLQAYAEAADVDGLFKYIEEHEELLYSGSAYIDLIPIMASKGIEEHIPKIVEKIKGLNRWGTYANSAIVRMSISGQFNAALHLMKALPSQAGNKFRFFLEDIVEAGMEESKIFEICREMRNHGLNDYSYEAVLRHYYRRGDKESAFNIIKEMAKENIVVRTNYLYPLFNEMDENSEPEAIYSRLDSILRLQIPLDSFLLTTFVIPSLELKTLDDYCDAFARMTEERGSLPSSPFSAGIVDHLFKEKKYTELVGFVNRFKRGMTRTVGRERMMIDMMMETSPKLSVQALKQFLPFLIRNPELAGDDLPSEGVNNFSAVGMIMVKYVERVMAQQPSQLEETLVPVFKAMQDLAISVGPFGSNIMEKLGDSCTDEMKEILTELSNEELRPVDGTSGISQVRVLERQLSQGLTEVGEVEISLQMRLLKNYARMGKLDKIEELVDSIKKMDEKISPLCQMIIIEQYLRNNRLADAEKYINDFLEDNTDFVLDPKVSLSYAISLVEADRFEDAIKAILLLSPASGDWSSVKNPMRFGQQKEFFDRLFGALVEKSDVALVTRLQDALLSRKYGDPKMILPYLIEYHLKNDNLTEALTEFENIAKEHDMVVGKRLLSRALIEKDDIDRLQQIVNISSKVFGEMNTLYDLVFDFVECGKLEQAEKILQTPGLRILHDKIDGQLKFLLNVGNYKMVEDLVGLTKDMLQVDKQMLFSHLLKAYIQQDLPEKAVDVWTTMQEEGINSSDLFLIQLSNYLKSKGLEPPFKVDDSKYRRDQIAETPSFSYQEARHQNNTTTIPKQSNNQSLNLQFKFQNDQKDKAVEEVTDLLSRGVILGNSTLTTYLKELGELGDVTNIRAVESLVDESTLIKCMYKYHLGISYLRSDRTEEYLNNLTDQVTEMSKEEFVDYKGISPGFFIKILCEKTECHSLVENLADVVATTKNSPSIHAILFDYYLATGETDKANTVYESHLINYPKLHMRHTMSRSLQNEDISLLNQASDFIAKHPEGRVHLVAQATVTHCNILLKQEKPQEAMDHLTESLKTISLKNFRSDDFRYLERRAKQNNVPFPHSLPKRRARSSSSSSSDSD